MNIPYIQCIPPNFDSIGNKIHRGDVFLKSLQMPAIVGLFDITMKMQT